MKKKKPRYRKITLPGELPYHEDVRKGELFQLVNGIRTRVPGTPQGLYKFRPDIQSVEDVDTPVNTID
jgi:hypothetical protein